MKHRFLRLEEGDLEETWGEFQKAVLIHGDESDPKGTEVYILYCAKVIGLHIIVNRWDDEFVVPRSCLMVAFLLMVGTELPGACVPDGPPVPVNPLTDGSEEDPVVGRILRRRVVYDAENLQYQVLIGSEAVAFRIVRKDIHGHLYDHHTLSHRILFRLLDVLMLAEVHPGWTTPRNAE